MAYFKVLFSNKQASSKLLDDYNVDPSVEDVRHWNPDRNGTFSVKSF